MPSTSRRGTAARRRAHGGPRSAPASAIASFDVFDTVLTRAVTSPRSVFLLLGRRLVRAGALPVSPQAFALARTEAERRVNDLTHGPATLEEIYSELGHGFSFSADDLARLREAEIELEVQLLHPVPAGRAMVDAARAEGNRIIFISDMYLPADLVERVLKKHGLHVGSDRLYVSGDHGRTKASGDLFRQVLADEAIAPGDMTHTGNDRRGDVRSPHRLGLATRPLLDANLNRYEGILDRHAAATDGLAAALGGAARLARLCVPASGQDTILRDVAASVGGPTLVAYVAWVLNDAQRRGIEHLHFLSRDGQVLLEIACRLAPKLGYAGQLAYLACSRKATNFAAFGADLAREAPWLWTRQSSPTCASLLAQVGIEPNEIESELAALGLLSDTWLRPLDERRRQRLLAFLQGPYRPRLDARHAEQRALVLDYLDGEGFLKDAPVGVVDLGGAGSQYRALRILRQQMDRSAPTGFVAHLDRPPAGDHEAAGALADDDLHAWLNDMRRNLGFPRFRGLAAVLLMYCKADHGTVVAYRRRGGRVEPILAPTSGSERAQRQFRIVRDTILRVADEVVLDEALVNPRADVRRPIWEALLLFWKRPSRAEAATLQWLELEESPHPDRDGGDRLASPYGVTDLVHLLRHRAWPGPWYSWPNASVEVSPTPIRGLLKAALWLRRRRPRRG